MAAQDQTKFSSKLTGTTILIVGGTSGLGFALAEALLEQHPPVSHIIVSSSNPSRIESALSKLRASYPVATKTTKLDGVTCDLGDEDELEENIKGLFEKLPLDAGKGEKLNHVVHTAGDKLATTPVADLTFGAVKRVGLVRFFAPFLIAKYMAPYLPSPANPDTSLTITGGGLAERPIKDWPVAASYAAGLQGMTRSLALDLKPIRVNLVQPGLVDTEMWGEARDGMRQYMAQALATGRAGRVEDVVEGFLMCLKDGNLTGGIVKSDGGHAVL